MTEQDTDVLRRRAEASNIRISTDLVEASQEELLLLQAVDRFPCLLAGPGLMHAISRYEKFWLPLAAESAERDAPLSPPLDVAWVWHCHMLNPVAYEADCLALLGAVLDNPGSDASGLRRQASCETSRQIWQQRYPTEPYDVDLSEFPVQAASLPPASPGPPARPPSTKLKYDLAAAAARQAGFFYQVSRPWMNERDFLLAALERYRCFLWLMQNNRTTFCVPTYDIDVMWHAHMRRPKSYLKDTRALKGRVISHDDTDGDDRSPDGRLADGFRETSALWANAFGIPYERAGAMYRGASPASAPPLPEEQAQQLSQTALGLPVVWATPAFSAANGSLVKRYSLQACITITDVTPPLTGPPVKVRVKLLKGASYATFETEEVQSAEMGRLVGKSFSFSVELGTQGVSIDLMQLKEACCLGPIWSSSMHSESKWDEVRGAPQLLLCRTLNGRGNDQPKVLEFTVSVTPPMPAPFLFTTVPAEATDDAKQPATRSSFTKHGASRWVTRVVQDHRGRPAFRVRIKAAVFSSASGKMHPVDGANRAIEVQSTHSDQGGVVWRVVTIAPSLFALELHNRDPDPILALSWWTDAQGGEHPRYDLQQMGAVQLLPGRWLQYEVPGSPPQAEFPFATLVRHTPEAPGGRATAVFNWADGTMEVAPDESVVLVVLLSAAIGAWFWDTKGSTNPTPPRFKPPNREPAKFGDTWGAVTMERGMGGRAYNPWYNGPNYAFAFVGGYLIGTAIAGACGYAGCGAGGAACGGGGCGGGDGGACGGAGCGGGGCGGGCGGCGGG